MSSTGQGTLAHVWAFDQVGGGDHPQPHELTPRSGDNFTPEFTTYTSKGDELEEGTRAGEPITFGIAEFRAFEGPAANGQYTIGLLVENTAGDITDQYIDIEVQDAGAVVLPTDVPDDAPVSGSLPGTLEYRDADLGFRIAYPDDWEADTSSQDKVMFSSPDEDSWQVLSVDMFNLDSPPAEANQDILQELLLSMQAEQDFTSTAITDTTLAGLAAREVSYSLTDDDTPITGRAIALTDPATKQTYLITTEFASDDDQAARLAELVASFELTK